MALAIFYIYSVYIACDSTALSKLRLRLSYIRTRLSIISSLDRSCRSLATIYIRLFILVILVPFAPALPTLIPPVPAYPTPTQGEEGSAAMDSPLCAECCVRELARARAMDRARASQCENDRENCGPCILP
jgi:hypothetical protein